jgi:hypothetical protein
MPSLATPDRCATTTYPKRPLALYLAPASVRFRRYVVLRSPVNRGLSPTAVNRLASRTVCSSEPVATATTTSHRDQDWFSPNRKMAGCRTLRSASQGAGGHVCDRPSEGRPATVRREPLHRGADACPDCAHPSGRVPGRSFYVGEEQSTTGRHRRSRPKGRCSQLVALQLVALEPDYL